MLLLSYFDYFIQIPFSVFFWFFLFIPSETLRCFYCFSWCLCSGCNVAVFPAGGDSRLQIHRLSGSSELHADRLLEDDLAAWCQGQTVNIQELVWVIDIHKNISICKHILCMLVGLCITISPFFFCFCNISRIKKVKWNVNQHNNVVNISWNR